MKVVDLFCGCGGLSLGARKAGFEVALSIDADPLLSGGYEYNFPGSSRLLADISALSGYEIGIRVNGRIDGIIGGPPCQGFSENGLSNPDDPRRKLLGHFFRIVSEVRPRFFLMENVRGLAFPKNKALLDAAISIVDPWYDVIGPLQLDASSFGAATSRPRIFVIGVERSENASISLDDIKLQFKHRSNVYDAIADLGNAEFIGLDTNGYDKWRYPIGAPVSEYASSLRASGGVFTGHRIVVHKPEIASRFASILPGRKDPIGRHVKLDWHGQCPTLRAGTGPERGGFQSVRPLHPHEPRVITVREAARLQGFPDNFLFHPTVWHSFRMIGNSVSPFAGEGMLRAIRSRMLKNNLPIAAE